MRHRPVEREPELAPALERLIDPATRGDPQSPLRWTCKSTGRLAVEMTQAGHPISAGTVASLLKKQGYSLQGNRSSRISIRPSSGLQCKGSRCRLWKAGLQQLAKELRLCIRMCHFPPGASKWNTIEHRMFSHITQNWRGQPLISHEVILSLIANTTTRTGLIIRAELDRDTCPIDIKVSDEDLADLALERDDFHAEWNYVLLPQ